MLLLSIFVQNVKSLWALLEDLCFVAIASRLWEERHRQHSFTFPSSHLRLLVPSDPQSENWTFIAKNF